MSRKKNVKQLSKQALALVADVPCPRCEELKLSVVDNKEIFCSDCGCHVSPAIFKRLIEGG